MNTDNPYAQLYASASQILSSIRNAPDAEMRLRPAPGVHRNAWLRTVTPIASE